MRAMMSDREARADINVFDSLPRAPWMTDESGWQALDLWAFNAELEAKRILAVSEPGTEGWGLVPYYTIQPFVARDSGARLCSGLLAGSEYGDALAEALKGFLGVTQ